MIIVADENIPYVRELFSPLGEVRLKPGRNLQAEDVKDANILLVRSVTKVNEALLEGSQVEFVGTCTIGMDHLDTQYLDRRGTNYSSAPGCNANAVVQYVVSVLAQLNQLETGKSVAVVGGGNVGSRVYQVLKTLGFKCVCVDPFIATEDTSMTMEKFSVIYSADIICMHTPYTVDGEYPTHKMLGEAELAQLKPNVILINAGRGGVIDNHALEQALKTNDNITAVLDVWESEPSIRSSLIDYVTFGSPHIAGYSFEGRVTGSLMIFDALCDHLKLPHHQSESILTKVCDQAFGAHDTMTFTSLKSAVLQAYDVGRDYSDLKLARNALPVSFDLLRKNYRKRREFSHYLCRGVPDTYKSTMMALGFLVDEQ